eukprot:scaffold535688_cov42-Prasinocladus_malaysianus.AAC.1
MGILYSLYQAGLRPATRRFQFTQSLSRAPPSAGLLHTFKRVDVLSVFRCDGHCLDGACAARMRDSVSFGRWQFPGVCG